MERIQSYPFIPRRFSHCFQLNSFLAAKLTEAKAENFIPETGIPNPQKNITGDQTQRKKST